MKETRLKRAEIHSHHLRPGRTNHSENGVPFPPFVALEIVRFDSDPGFYLMHIAEDGSRADTYHSTIEDAMHQAEFEFEVRPDEWNDAPAT